jgi:hypothetical protein
LSQRRAARLIPIEPMTLRYTHQDSSGDHQSKRNRMQPCFSPETCRCYSCQGHNNEQGKSSACECLSGAGCRVAHQLLQELGLKYGCGIQDAADQDHEQTTDSEILILK